MTSDKATLIAEAVYAQSAPIGVAVEIVAKVFGITPQTVRRNLRRAKRQNRYSPVTVTKNYHNSPLIGQPSKKVLRGIAIGDTHDDPRIPKDRFYWLGKLAADTKADFVIQIGDFITLDSLCRYIDNASYEARKTPLYLHDMQSQEEALSAFDKGLGKFKPKIKHITLGNHEDRVESWSNRHPEIYGIMSGMMLDNFAKHGWTVSEFGQMYYIGGVGFVHVPLNEMGKPYGGKTAESRVANDALHDVVFGHSHRNRVYTASKVGDGQHLRIINLGCALPEGHVEKYAKHSSTGWTYGAYELEIADGHITDWNFVSMNNLEKLYG